MLTETRTEITPRHLEWFAGFYEGEGSCFCKAPNSVRLTIAQVNREPLERCQTLFGGAIYPIKRQKENHQQCYRWELVGSHAAGLLMTIYCLLSNKRRDQVRSALQEWRTILTAAKFRETCKHGHVFDEVGYYITNNGARDCKACHKAAVDRYNIRQGINVGAGMRSKSKLTPE